MKRINLFIVISLIMLIALVICGILVVDRIKPSSSNKLLNLYQQISLTDRQAAKLLPCQPFNWAAQKNKSSESLKLSLTCLADGKVAQLSKLIDKTPTLINFWGYDCPVCIKELPILQKVNSLYKSKLKIVTIHISNNSYAAIKQLTFLGVHLMAFEDANRGFFNYLALPNVIPITIFINDESALVHIHPAPYLQESKLISDIARFLTVRV